MASVEQTLEVLNRRIIACRRCPRLVRYREQVARQKRRAFADQTYWGRPVPGFGDPRARFLIVGLAPAAHGGNRTGRMFTGDRSGDFLYDCLFRAGFSNQPQSVDRNDGLELFDVYITAVARCCPPKNRPLPEEIANCRPYLACEFDCLQPRVVLALGQIALHGFLSMLKERGQIPGLAPYRFRHGARYRLPPPLPVVYASYHPSQQNTFTGRLTRRMLLSLLRRIRRELGLPVPGHVRTAGAR